MTADDALALADEIDNHARYVTDWEAEFLDSLMKRCEQGVPPTDRQAEVLERIYQDRM